MYPMYQHQKEAKQFILDKKGVGALFHDVGSGKTRTAIEIFAELKSRNLCHTMIVVCPLNLITHAWGEDIAKWSNFTWSSLRDKRFNHKADIYIVNYEWIIRNNLPFAKSSFLVLDESSKIKNPKSKTTIELLRISDKVDYKLIMTGTPAPNSELEYFCQMRFLSKTIFGDSDSCFKNKYFHLGRGNQKFQGTYIDKKTLSEMFSKGWKYVTTGVLRKDMFSKMKPFIHQIDQDKCMDLPDKVYINRYVQLGNEQKKQYKEMEEEMITAIFDQAKSDDELDFVIAKNGAVKYMKLRQVTSGFLIDADKTVHVLKEQPKLKELKIILEELGNQQVIIWINFHHEAAAVLDLIGEDKCATLYGKTKDKNENIRLFKSGERQYLVAHPASAGHGLTLVNSSVEVFYSVDPSYERYHQAQGRIRRPGQKAQFCRYIHILAENTIDDNIIMPVLQRKGSLLDIMKRYMLNKKKR